MFFSQTTVGEVKTEYRRLAKLYHPDLGGDLEMMKQVNISYHNKLSELDGQTSLGSDGKNHTYRYRHDTEQAVMDKIAELLAMQMDGVTIEIIGAWVWLTGNTKPYRKLLGKDGAKCRWHSKRVAWYWHGKTYRRKMSNWSMDDMRKAYGSRILEQEESRAVVLA